MDDQRVTDISARALSEARRFAAAGELRSSLVACRIAKDLLVAQGRHEQIREVLRIEATVLARQGRVVEAQVAREALAAVATWRQEAPIGGSQELPPVDDPLVRGLAHLRAGDLPGAWAVSARAMDDSHQPGSRWLRGRALLLAALASECAGATPTGSAAILGALKLAHQTGDRETEAAACLFIARAALREGRLDAAAAFATRALGWAEHAVDHRVSGAALLVLGNVMRKLGRHDESARLLRNAISDLEASGEIADAAEARAALGRVLVASGRSFEGLALLRDAMKQADAGRSPASQIHALADMAQALQDAQVRSGGVEMERARGIALRAGLDGVLASATA